MSEFIDVEALLQIVIAGILVGAGLPALFALGLRLLVAPAAPVPASAGASEADVTGGASVAQVATAVAAGTSGPAGPVAAAPVTTSSVTTAGGTTVTTVTHPRPALWRIGAAALCFGTVVAAVVIGIVFLANGGH